MAFYEMIYNKEGKPIDYQIIDANPAYEEEVGKSREEILGKKGLEVMDQAVDGGFYDFCKVTETGEVLRLEKYENSINKYVVMTIFPFQKSQFAILFYDNTVYKKKEQALVERQKTMDKYEEIYELVVEGSNDEIWDWLILEDEGIIYLKNCCDFPIKEELLKPFYARRIARIHPEDVKEVEKTVKKYLAREEDYYKCEYRVKQEDGTYGWVLSRGKAIWNEQGYPIRMAGSYTDITEKKFAEEKFRYVAYHDTLTYLPNKIAFEEMFPQMIKKAELNRELLGFVFLDVDNFKHINDMKGHSFGDQVLKRIGAIFQDYFHEEGAVFRWGGDEFIILISSVQTVKEIETRLLELLERFQHPWIVDQFELFITISLGVSLYPYDGKHVEVLLQKADMAMYQAKQKGKNRYQLYEKTMENSFLRKIEIERGLRKALKYQQFELHYQPLFRIRTGKIIGMEALLRWNHPELGPISPLEFIPIAEESGLIIPIGEWVLREACRQNKRWQQMGFDPIKISVNLSAHQFFQPHLKEKIITILKETKLNPRYLELEVTESVAVESSQKIIEILTELKELGISIALDDFGTGYSSLNYLQWLPIQHLKIDQSFIKGLEFSSTEVFIIQSLISLAHHLDLVVTAEGIETEQQFEFLRNYGCDTVQGYFLSPPLLKDECEELLKSKNRIKNSFSDIGLY